MKALIPNPTARRVWTKACAVLFAILGTISARGQFVFNETFSHSTFDQSGWVVASSNGTYVPALTASAAGGNVDVNGAGWLRMTNNLGSEATYARLTTPIPSASNNITVDLQYQMWTPNATGADGFTISLRDASVANFDVGAFGGSLGYAQKTTAAGGDTTHAGMAGGYFSVGVDAFGNFSNATEGRVGGPGSRPDAIAVRGPGSGTGTSYNGGTNNNYAYINGTSNLNQAPYNLGTINFTGVNSRPVDSSASNERELVFNFTTSNILTVSMRFGATGTLTQVFQADLTLLGARPENLELVFTAGTGGSMQYTEIKGLSIATSGAPVGTIYYSNYAGDNKWGTGNNWGNASTPNLGVVPTNYANLVFSNHAFTAPAFQLTTAQNVDLGTNRSAGSIQFDAPFNYTLQGYTLTLDSGQTNTPTAITVTSAAPGGAHTLQSAIALNSDLNINTNTNTALNISGNINAGTHTFTINNNGTTTIAGQITGSGSMTQSSSSTGTTVITGDSSDTYTGNITVEGGTIRLGNSDVLSSSTTVTLSTANSYGTLDLANNNQTLGGINFVSGGLVQSGSGTLTLNGNVTSQSSATMATIAGNLNLGSVNRTFSVSDGGVTPDMLVSASVSGTGGLLKTGNGSLTLSGVNSYSGGTTVSAGTVIAASNTALGTGTASVSSSATLGLQGGINLSSGTISVSGNGFTGSNGAIDNRSGNNTLSSNVTLAGNTVVGASSGTQLTFAGAINEATASNLTAGGTGTVVLAGNNSYTGVTTINAGATLAAASNNALGSNSAGTTVASGGTLAFQGGINYTTAEAVTVSGTGASTRNGAIDNLSGNNVFAGNIGLAGNTQIGANSGTNLTLSGSVSGNSNLTVAGTGTILLSGNNSYTGITTVNSGATLVGASNNALGNTGANTATTVLSGGTLGFQNGVTVNFENLTINGAGVGNNGALTSYGGANTVTNQIVMGSNSTIAAANGSTLTLSGGISDGAGAFSLTKADTGTVVIAGPATYDGSTTISGGTLSLAGANGALSNTSAININGATLRLDNSAANNTNRIGTAPVTLNDGGITIVGNGATASTETMAITVSTGANNIHLSAGATSKTDLTISNLVQQNNASIAFFADTGILGAGTTSAGVLGSPRVFISNINGGAIGGNLSVPLALPGWILVGTDFSEYTGGLNTGNGVRAVQTYDMRGLNVNVSTANVLLNNTSTNLEYNLTRGATNSITTDGNLKISDLNSGGGTSIATLMNNRTLVLNNGGIVKAAGANNVLTSTIDGSAAFLQAGANVSNLTVTTDTGTTLTINPTIQNYQDKSNSARGLVKAGAGTLVLTGTNTYTGNNVLNDGTLQISKESNLGALGNNLSFGGSATLAVTGSFTTNSGKAISIASNSTGTFDIASGQTLSISNTADLLSTGNSNSVLSKTNTGTLVVAASNSGFTGSAIVNAGTLELQSGNALGVNRMITLNGGTMSLKNDATTTYANNITVTADSTIRADRFSTGSGLTLSLGTVAIGANTLTTSGGNFYDMKLGNVTVSGSAVLNPNTAGSDLSVGAVSGAGGITKTGVANLTYTAASTYAGATTVSAGTLFTQGTNFLPTTTALTIADGATVNTNGNSQKIASLAGGSSSATAVFNLGTGGLTAGDSTTTSFGGTLTAGSFTKTGSGTLTLNGGTGNALSAFAINDGTIVAAKSAGDATGSGNITVGDIVGGTNSAVLRLGSANQINDASSMTINSDGRLDLAGYNETIASIAGSGSVNLGAGVLTLTGNATTTYSGGISGSGGVVKGGTGTLTLAGNSNYSGATTINAGAIQISTSSALGTGAGGVTVANGAALELSSNINVNGAALSIIGSGASGIGAFRNLSGDNTWGGTVTLAGAATISVSAGNLYLAGGINTGANALTISGSGNTQATGAITGSGSIIKNGIGALVLGASGNTYTGATTINGGSLQINANGAGPASSAVNLTASGTTLNVNNYAAAVGSLTGVDGSNVTLGSGSLTTGGSNASTTYSGTISGAGGSFYKTGTGTFTVGGSTSNTLSGVFNVSDGTAILSKSADMNATGTGALNIGDGVGASGSAVVQLNAANQIYNATAVTVNMDGRLNLNNNSETIGSLAGNGAVALGSGTLTTGGNNASTTFSGTISGTGGLVKQGTGVMTLTSANSFSGGTTVAGGTLALAASNAISPTTTLTISSGAGVALSGGVSQTVAGLGTASTSSISIGANATLTVNTASASTLLGSITGTGTLAYTGGANLTIGNSLTFGGTLSVGGTTIGSTPTTTLYLTGNISLGTLNITGDTVLDFGNSAATTLNVGTLNIASGAKVTVRNWVNLSDYFYANYFPGAVPNQQGNTPVPNNASTQITFNGYTNSQTSWQSFDHQITPAPEPATYGAIFVGAALGCFGLFRWRRRTGQRGA